MGHPIMERVVGSRLGVAVAALVATYALAGIPILHLWSKSYFKGSNLLTYQIVFVLVFLGLWLIRPQSRDAEGSVARFIGWGLGVGLLAGVLAHSVADYSIMEPGTSIGSWLSTRVTMSNLVIMSLALLPWLFGAVFGAITWFLRRQFGGAPAHAQ